MSNPDETSDSSIDTVSIKNRGRTELDKWLPFVNSEFTVTDVIRLVDDYNDILILKTDSGFNVLVDKHIEGIDIQNPDVSKLTGATFKHVKENDPLISPNGGSHHHLVQVGEEPDWVRSQEEKNVLTL